MLHSPDEVKEIKSLIILAKSKPINIGICIGDSPDNAFILMDRKRKPMVLAKKARAEVSGAKKVVAGRITVDGKDATITCAEEPAGTMARQLKLAFKEIAGLTMDFTFTVDTSIADEVDTDGPDTPAQSTPAPSYPAPSAQAEAAAPNTGASQSDWDDAWGDALPRLAILLAKAGEHAPKLTAVRDFALGKAAAGQFDAALKALKSLVQLMDTVSKVLADAKPAEAPDARTLAVQLGQIKPQIAALQGPVGVKLTDMFQAVVGQVKSGALKEAAAGLAKITAALEKIATSTAQAMARASAQAEMAANDPEPQSKAAPRNEKLAAVVAQLRGQVGRLPGGDAGDALVALLDKIEAAIADGQAERALGDLKRVQDGLKLQAEVDRLAPLVAAAAASGKVADVNALTRLFDHVASTIPATDHAKAMESLSKVEAMIAEGARQDTTAFKAGVPDDVRPFITSRLSWATARSTLRAELGRLQKAIADAVAGMEGMEGAAGNLGPLFGHIEKLDDRLEDKLDQIVSSKPGPDRWKLKIEARRLLEAYRAELANPFFADVDEDNGFMPVAVASTARGAMADLSKVLAA